jgi:predicted metal-binding protein
MKKFFTLVAMAMMAVGANAQAVVAEIDWTQESEWNGMWYSTDYAAVSVEQGTGLIIDCSSDGTTNYWEPQVPMIGHIAEITEGGQYQVKFTAQSPVAGELRLDFCSWDGTGATHSKIINVTTDMQEYTVDFEDYPTECTDAMIFYQCGKLPGKHIIQNVKVLDLEGEGGEQGGAAVVAEIDWTQESEWNGMWYSTDYAAVSVEQGTGLIIDCSSDGTTNYWEPQVPMIGHIAEVTEGGQYQVIFTVDSPAAGEIRLDFCSWDGTGATHAKIINVEAGEHEYTVDFEDYPTECTDAMIFYQCGKIPGRHIIKKVTLYDTEATGIEAVKADQKFNGAIYNLAGQKVNANYKGVVIQNGKKFIQK